ncbi:carotenoid oxygenase family protein [Mycobacteroides abscessus]|uniref:carotenoid oxygenase family protein n=1 Tax=Mycobacteroides abscessus TaxID=36809 RepID=UPI0026703D98|nr:carotenoid oxygenase family protein [Mycobacteroides abscessus]MDO3107380.1 carotenoid oxygenase family protein [Mycobacteroides abscessus subsp. abscessus]
MASPEHVGLWREGPDDVAGGMPTLHRWILNLTTGTITETFLNDTASEHPRISESLRGQPHRFGYTHQLRPAGRAELILGGPATGRPAALSTLRVHRSRRGPVYVDPGFMDFAKDPIGATKEVAI